MAADVRLSNSATAKRVEQAFIDGKEPDQADLMSLLNILMTRNAQKPCLCGHTKKKHKQSGHCRKKCQCDWAGVKAERKRRRDDSV